MADSLRRAISPNRRSRDICPAASDNHRAPSHPLFRRRPYGPPRTVHVVEADRLVRLERALQIELLCHLAQRLFFFMIRQPPRSTLVPYTPPTGPPAHLAAR